MKKKVIAISGSTRKASSNLNLIKAIAALSTPFFNIEILESIDQLPHFNPDLDNENVNDTVVRFRSEIKHAAGVLICTPEYAMGVPGTLKNAIDWTVSSGEFSHKPVALITAGTSGEKAHESLLGTLRVIEAHIPEECQLIIPFIKTKLKDTQITDPATLQQVQKLVRTFSNLLEA